MTAGRAWTDGADRTDRAVEVDDDPTQEFPVLTDELIAQIEAEAAEQAAAEQQLEAEEFEHKRAVGE